MNNPKLLAEGLRGRIYRLIARSRPDQWRETEANLVKLRHWLLEVFATKA